MKLTSSSAIDRRSSLEEIHYVLSPSSFVANFVNRLREHVKNSLGHPATTDRSQPCISLLQWRQPFAERNLYDVYTKVSALKPFHISVKDLTVIRQDDHFTICLDIVHKTPIYEVVENLTIDSERFIPLITVAEGLSVDEFLRVWKDLKSISFSDHFRCDHITVLKKNRHRWVHYLDIPFAA